MSLKTIMFFWMTVCVKFTSARIDRQTKPCYQMSLHWWIYWIHFGNYVGNVRWRNAYIYLLFASMVAFSNVVNVVHDFLISNYHQQFLSIRIFKYFFFNRIKMKQKSCDFILCSNLIPYFIRMFSLAFVTWKNTKDEKTFTVFDTIIRVYIHKRHCFDISSMNNRILNRRYTIFLQFR